MVAPITPRTAEEACSVESNLSADDWYVTGLELECAAPQEAKRAYESALELDPNHADAHVNLGRLLHAECRTAEAATHYEQALESQPEHATAAFDLGVALEDLDRPSDAIRAYERAIRSDPRYADAHYNLAALYEKAGKPAAALRHLASYRRIADAKD
jgi:tetratricopeptide (TPR) repeat protein